MTDPSPNYRRLGRNNSGHGHFLRSFSSFFLLLAIVVLLLLFYLYFNTSSELQGFRTDYDELNARHLKLKNELFDINVKMETLKKSESECKSRQEKLDNKNQECQTELGEKANLLTQMQRQKTECEKNTIDLNEKIESIKQQYDRKDAETQAKSESQATLITNLTQTIEQLQKELALVRSTNQIPNNQTSTQQTLRDTGTTMKTIERTDINVNNQQNDDTAHEKQNNDFIVPRRSPGGRVHLEEQAEQREKSANHKELLNAAEKLNEQQKMEGKLEESDHKNNDLMPAENFEEIQHPNKQTVKTNANNNRPLVDVPPVYYKDALNPKDEEVEFEDRPNQA